MGCIGSDGYYCRTIVCLRILKFEYIRATRSEGYHSFNIDRSSFLDPIICYRNKIMDTSTFNRKIPTVCSTERPISSVYPSFSPTDSFLSTSTTSTFSTCSLSADLVKMRGKSFAGNITFKRKLGYRLYALKQLLRT